VYLEACRERLIAVLGSREGGQRDHRHDDAQFARSGPDLPDQGEAVVARHGDVTHDDVRP